MSLWAKLSSIAIMLFGIYGLYLGVSFLVLYISNSQFITLKTTIFFILSVILTIFFMLIFYSPLFYYGWVKKPKNEGMKSFAKILTIIFPVLAIVGFISPWGLDFPKDALVILPAFALIGPLYYYAWRKK